jgi:hypothetical protein
METDVKGVVLGDRRKGGRALRCFGTREIQAAKYKPSLGTSTLWSQGTRSSQNRHFRAACTSNPLTWQIDGLHIDNNTIWHLDTIPGHWHPPVSLRMSFSNIQHNKWVLKLRENDILMQLLISCTLSIILLLFKRTFRRLGWFYGLWPSQECCVLLKCLLNSRRWFMLCLVYISWLVLVLVSGDRH